MRFKEYLQETMHPREEIKALMQKLGDTYGVDYQFAPGTDLINVQSYVIDSTFKEEILIGEDGKLKVAFNEIDWYFRCRDIKSLRSVEGLPIKVGGDLDISHCSSLTSLKGLPTKFVDGFFDITGTGLTSLEGSPHEVGYYSASWRNSEITSFKGISRVVKNIVDLQATNITSLVGIADAFDRIGRGFRMKWDNIKEGGLGLIMIAGLKQLLTNENVSALTPPFQIIEKYLGRPEDLFECQTELIAAGYEEYAKL